MTFESFVNKVMELNEKSENILIHFSYHYGCNGHTLTLDYEDGETSKLLAMCERITPEKLDRIWQEINEITTRNQMQIMKNKVEKLEELLRANGIEYKED